MIIFDTVQQGTSAWQELRTGRPTASQFHRIITPKTGKFSEQSEGYLRELVAEQILGKKLDDATSGYMERGTLLEKKAIDYYLVQRDVDVKRVGFIMRDDRRVGCSPDALVGADGLLEIKVPSAAVHVGYLMGDGLADKYRCQLQGQLWLAERSWIESVSYNPDMPTSIARQERDDAFIAKLSAAVDQFLEMLDDAKEKLQKEHGLFPDFKRPELKVA